MNVLRGIWFALRHGEWDCGCEFYEGKPMFGFCTAYYDGHHATLHVGPLWVGVFCY